MKCEKCGFVPQLPSITGNCPWCGHNNRSLLARILIIITFGIAALFI